MTAHYRRVHLILIKSAMDVEREQLSKNFFRDEFSCPCCGKDDVKDDLARRVQEVRDLLEKSITINSGVRCSAHNKSVGSKESSSHLTGYAADIRCDSSFYRKELLTAVSQVFDRFGIAQSFIHVDVDPSKSASCWLYT